MEDHIVLLRNTIKSELGKYESDLTRQTAPLYDVNSYQEELQFNYNNYRAKVDKDSFTHLEIYLSHYPDKWIPSYSYLHQQFISAEAVGVKIYDPLQFYDEEMLMKDIKSIKYTDYALILLGNEITDGAKPSFIEIRTAACMLNDLQVYDSLWDYKYWVNKYDITDDNSYYSIGQSTLLRILIQASPHVHSPTYGVIVEVKSMDPFEDSIKSLPHVLEMYRKCQGQPEDKADIIESYKDVTNLPLLSLWHIVHELDIIHEFNEIDSYNVDSANYLLSRICSDMNESANYLLSRICFDMIVCYKYLVCSLRDLFDSYKEAYPKGYFKSDKSAMSAR